MQSTLYSCPILLKLAFSRQIFEKYSSIKFHENPPSRSQVVPCDRLFEYTMAVTVSGLSPFHSESKYKFRKDNETHSLM